MKLNLTRNCRKDVAYNIGNTDAFIAIIAYINLRNCHV